MEGTKIKGIIFDKDGTLYDYVQVWAPGIKNVIRTVFISLNIKDSKEAREHLYQIIGIDNEYNIYKDGIVFNHHKVVRAFFKLLGFCIKHRVNPFSFYLPSFICPFLTHRIMLSSDNGLHRSHIECTLLRSRDRPLLILPHLVP